MSREMSSPIDLPEAPLDRLGLGWASIVIGIATIFLLIGNAVSLRDWIDDLPPGAAQARASALAGNWLDLTQTAAIGQPRAWLHDLWKAAEAARF